MPIDNISAYRIASEALHRDHAAVAAEKRAAHYRMLWQCGLAELIREDFYELLGLPRSAAGNLLDAGCGTGFDSLQLQQRAPAVVVHGVDVSAVALAAASKSRESGPSFYQAALERLPFAAASFNYLCSHEVIEHVEDPAVVLGEFSRVLMPGGICVIATPNGASWWIEHLRQRFMRLLGRRGAPIGEDHTRSPRFWRREFERAGFIVERRILDGAALEFLLFVAPARWMPWLTRLLEPLRVVPGINLVLCDRVKFRLCKPGKPPGTSRKVVLCCPLCRCPLMQGADPLLCEGGHRFSRNAVGLFDFITPVSERPAETEPPSGDAAAVGRGVEENSGDLVRGKQSPWVRRLRRLALRCFGIVYAGWLVLLAPVGAIAVLFHQPFHRAPHRLKTEV